MKKICTDNPLYEDALKLLNKADAARSNTYAPYSSISVGAALLDSDGEIHLGVNVENCAHSPGICAERSAFVKAISEGKHRFTMIAVQGGGVGESPKARFYPCGVCRQFMSEFCEEDFPIILLGEDSAECYTLGELFPFSFGKEKL